MWLLLTLGRLNAVRSLYQLLLSTSHPQVKVSTQILGSLTSLPQNVQKSRKQLLRCRELLGEVLSTLSLGAPRVVDTVSSSLFQPQHCHGSGCKDAVKAFETMLHAGLMPSVPPREPTYLSRDEVKQAYTDKNNE